MRKKVLGMRKKVHRYEKKGVRYEKKGAVLPLCCGSPKRTMIANPVRSNRTYPIAFYKQIH